MFVFFSFLFFVFLFLLFIKLKKKRAKKNDINKLKKKEIKAIYILFFKPEIGRKNIFGEKKNIPRKKKNEFLHRITRILFFSQI